ncbi:hypothetical protein JKP88DRAFT_269265 [Tribonema minus]|uniref:2Fe-2S ferredoxin-type domain-containing protein n=1 Tax=Tribonema minus TaxID=303371 RepID=A0A836CRA8_9STRA|nr:hypothetical protein JKP88DRAFT_269265 [Tribonema minus]
MALHTCPSASLRLWLASTSALSLSRRSVAAAAADEPVNADGVSLEGIYKRLKIEILDLDEGIIGLESRDPAFGIEIVRGLVLIGDVGGNAAESGLINTGDTLTYVGNEAARDMTRVEGQDYDTTVAALGKYADLAEITLVLKRLVQRKTLEVTFETPTAYAEDGTAVEWGGQGVQMLAGSNLRSEMIRRDIPVYDAKTRRFDQPYATGNCGGEGICGTCFVEVQEGAELLSPPDGLENMVMRNLPRRWRLSCRTVVGGKNEAGQVRLRSIPQSAYVAERKRDTRS